MYQDANSVSFQKWCVCDLLTLHLLSKSQTGMPEPMPKSAAVSVKTTEIPELLMGASVLVSTMCENDSTAFNLIACFQRCCNIKHAYSCELAYLVCLCPIKHSPESKHIVLHNDLACYMTQTSPADQCFDLRSQRQKGNIALPWTLTFRFIYLLTLSDHEP